MSTKAGIKTAYVGQRDCTDVKAFAFNMADCDSISGTLYGSLITNRIEQSQE